MPGFMRSASGWRRHLWSWAFILGLSWLSPWLFLACRAPHSMVQRSMRVARASSGEASAPSSMQAVLLVPGTEEAVEAFRKKFPQVMAKAEPDYLGTPCSEQDLRRRFQSLGETIGREEALGLALREPRLLAMQEENLRASWQAMLEVARQDRAEALQVVRRRPGCLIAPAAGFKDKTLADFEAVAEMEDAFRPELDALQDLGPEGVAMGAAALGMAALGAMAAKGDTKKPLGSETGKPRRRR